MSYANVTAKNSTPISEQPHPDPALLNTMPPSASRVLDETKKVSVVSQDFQMHPATTTSERHSPYPSPLENNFASGYPEERSTSKPEEELEAEADRKRHLLSPGMTAGMVGLFNAAVLGTIGYFSYINWNQPAWGHRTISTAAVGLLTLWGSEAFLADWYRHQHLSK